jgi:hypothetical protein
MPKLVINTSKTRDEIIQLLTVQAKMSGIKLCVQKTYISLLKVHYWRFGLDLSHIQLPLILKYYSTTDGKNRIVCKFRFSTAQIASIMAGVLILILFLLFTGLLVNIAFIIHQLPIFVCNLLLLVFLVYIISKKTFTKEHNVVREFVNNALKDQHDNNPRIS